MMVTIIATIMIMAGYFLLLYGAVGFVQDKWLFSSAPKEVFAVIPEKRERFPPFLSGGQRYRGTAFVWV